MSPLRFMFYYPVNNQFELVTHYFNEHDSELCI